MISVRTTIFETKEQIRFYIRNMLQSLIIIVKNINPINEELYIECMEMNLRFLVLNKQTKINYLKIE